MQAPTDWRRGHPTRSGLDSGVQRPEQPVSRAEFGNAQNGVVNAVTRSGSNRTQGRVFGYFQDDALNAKLWRATTKNPFGQQRSGAQVGGPILKDRLLYFVGYERNHSLTNIPVSISPIFVGNVPDVTLNAAGTQAVGTVEQDTVVHSIICKGGLSAGVGPYGDAAGHRPQVQSVRQRFGDGDERAVDRLPRPAISTERFVAGGVDVGDVVLLTSRQPGGVPAKSPSERVLCRSFAFWMAHLADSAQHSDVRVSVGRAHHRLQWPVGRRLRGGVVRERSVHDQSRVAHTESSEVCSCVRSITWSRRRIRAGDTRCRAWRCSAQPTRRRIPSATRSASSQVSILAGHWAAVSIGLFAQDTWRVGQELTLSLGIRFDAEAKVSTINEAVDAMEPPYNTHLNHVNPNLGNVAPRARIHVGAWRQRRGWRFAAASGCSTTRPRTPRSRGGPGRSAILLLPGGMLMNIASNNATLNPYCLGNTRCVGGVPADLQNALRQVMAFAIINNTVPNLAATSVTVNGVTTVLPGMAVSPIPLSVGHIEENLKTPFTRQETIGAQFDLGRGFSASADLKFIQGRDQYILRNVNLTTEGRIVDPVFQSLNKLGNGGVLDVKQLLVEVGYRSARRQHAGRAMRSARQATIRSATSLMA